ncbi:unnamed protein product [Macrosiphum euphorbiae]|uniref:Uncharacterized protein n=1 Tax=Macrosiphum euphorbiae TaxID=13131 RepID=A0AAV0WND1_9HEMI|nr:unnamed protein product [Macrosiphum euphorbiae]
MSSRSKQLIKLALKPITVVSSDEKYADFSTNQVANFHIEPNEKIDIEICKTACTKHPYIVEYLSYDFLKSFSVPKYCKSIRRGNKKGDPVVTNIKALNYKPHKEINYKLRFTEDWSNLPLLRNNKQNTVISEALPQLHMDRIKI